MSTAEQLVDKFLSEDDGHDYWERKNKPALRDRLLALLNSQTSALRSENQRLQQELKKWAMAIRPSQELLDAFAEQIYVQYVSFASNRGTYEHRMAVIKSAMLAYCKALLIEKGHAESRATSAEATVAELREALKKLNGILEDAPELNLSNYDHDQVAVLNSAMVEACLFSRSALLAEKGE